MTHPLLILQTPQIKKGHIMNIKAASLTAALAAASGAHADIIIDDWSVDQGPYVGHSWNQTATGDMLGGTRRIFQQNVGGLGEVFGEISDNRLRISGENGAQNFFTTYWDGADRGGIGGQDLTEGGANDRFRFDIITGNGSWRGTFLVKHTDGTFNRAEIDNSVDGGPFSGPVEIPFSDFTETSDFSSIEFVSFEVDLFNGSTSASQVTLGAFRVIPTPSSFLTLGAAGLLATKRRR